MTAAKQRSADQDSPPRMARHCMLAALGVSVLGMGGCNTPNRSVVRAGAGASPVAIHLVVATDGNDNAPGTAARPLATLAGARDRVRTLRAAQELSNAAVQVTVRGGSYRLHQSFVLEAQDGGSETAPVVYQAAEGEQVRLVGGVEVPPAAFRPVSDRDVLSRLRESVRGHVFCADLSTLVPGEFPRRPDSYRGFSGPELFFADERMTPARYPNEGWLTFTAKQVVDRGAVPRFGADSEKGGGTFEYTDPAPERWSAENGVWLYGYWCHDWYDEVIRVGTIDTEARRITLAVPHKYGIGPSQKWNTAPRRYVAINLLDELDAPGEWYLDTERKLLYFYPPDDLVTGHTVLSLVPDTLVDIRDTRFVRVRGFIIECGRGTGIAMAGADNLAEDCEVRNIMNGGRLAGVRNGFRRCHFHHLGSSGVGTGSGDRVKLVPAGNFIEDCHIHHFGVHSRTYAPAIGLRGCGNRASHNHIHHGPHLAIEYSGNENTIEYNHIHHVLLETSDAGAMYTGRDWTTQGNTIRFNFIHDLGGFGVGGGYAIYLDDQDSGDTIVGNVLCRAGKGIFIAGGRSNVARNNLIVDSASAFTLTAVGLRRAPVGDTNAPYGEDSTIMKRLRAMPYTEDPWKSRYPRLVTILEDEPRKAKYNIIRDNLIVNTKPGLAPSREAEAACWADPANGNVVEDNYVTDEDPGFVAPEDLDFSLDVNTDLRQRYPTFEPIPFEDVGPRQCWETASSSSVD